MKERLKRIRETAIGVLIGLVCATPLYVFAAWTSPRTWVAGETVTASLLNTHLRDNLSFLKGVTDIAVQRLNVNTTSVGNVGAGPDDLITYSLPAGTLATDGQGVRVTAWGVFAVNANAKQVIGNFGGTSTVTSSSSTTFNNISWEIRYLVIRTSATTQISIGTFITPDGAATAIAQQYTTPGETLSGAITIKCRGDGVADNDVIQRGLLVELIP